MITTIAGDARHFSDFGWLKTFWLFSFADYYAPDNIRFGPLRVFNDDVVMPGTGFPTHPHEEMEIITIVLDGEITHTDSLNNTSVIKAGDVQRMSAGTGLSHSEYNVGKKPVHLYQIWIHPDKHGLRPSNDQRSFKKEEWHNQLLPIASGQRHKNAVRFHNGATIYRAELDAGRAISYETTEERQIFLYLTSGSLVVNRNRLLPKYQARIDLEKNLVLQAEKKSDFILIDLPACRGWGYDKNTLRGARF
jgi:hypothetical protein